MKELTANADAKAYQHDELEGAEQPVKKRDRVLAKSAADFSKLERPYTSHIMDFIRCTAYFDDPLTLGFAVDPRGITPLARAGDEDVLGLTCPTLKEHLLRQIAVLWFGPLLAQIDHSRGQEGVFGVVHARILNLVLLPATIGQQRVPTFLPAHSRCIAPLA